MAVNVNQINPAAHNDDPVSGAGHAFWRRTWPLPGRFQSLLRALTQRKIIAFPGGLSAPKGLRHPSRPQLLGAGWV